MRVERGRQRQTGAKCMGEWLRLRNFHGSSISSLIFVLPRFTNLSTVSESPTVHLESCEPAKILLSETKDGCFSRACSIAFADDDLFIC